jgi:HSP20 family molecular chaperone IbpA
MSEQCTPVVKNDEGTGQCSREGVTYTPRFDICETENEMVLYGDLPGVEASDLDIRFEDKELAIHGKVAPRRAGQRRLRDEYGVGDFYRTFAVGEAVDAGKINAELKNGVLTIHLPKAESAKPKRIEVRAV